MCQCFCSVANHRVASGEHRATALLLLLLLLAGCYFVSAVYLLEQQWCAKRSKSQPAARCLFALTPPLLLAIASAVAGREHSSEPEHENENRCPLLQEE